MVGHMINSTPTDTPTGSTSPSQMTHVDTLDTLEWALVTSTSHAHLLLSDNIKSSLSSIHSDLPDLLNSVLMGDYKPLLVSCLTKAILIESVDDSVRMECFENGNYDLNAYVQHALSSYLSKNNNNNNQFAILLLGITCLNAFIQQNWTGPNLDTQATDLINVLSIDSETSKKEFNKKVLDSLSVDNEDPYHLCLQPLFLALSKSILCDNANLLESIKTLPWWQSRILFLQQRILDNQTATLKSALTTLFTEKLPQILPTTTTNPNYESTFLQDIQVRYYLEKGLFHHYFRQDRLAQECYALAQKVSGLVYELSGAMGKRTKFQIKDTAQLVVMAKSQRVMDDDDEKEEVEVDNEDKKEESTMNTEEGAPQNLKLNDDTLLEEIAFTNTEPPTNESTLTTSNITSNLWQGDQCILLAHCLNIKNSNPDHGLTQEQMHPFVTRVLQNANNWMIYTMGLLLRSRLESTKSRTVERSCFQLQALVDQMPLTDTKRPELFSAAGERIAWFWGISLPSKWVLERELGERFMSLGAVASALQIFEKLELWDDMIACHMVMEKPKKAEEIALKQLEITPTSPKFLCLLGDIRQDPSYYQQAWDASHPRRYARAMRSLGSYHFKRGNYPDSAACYQNALRINPLFENSWFVLGCAAIRCENYILASEAFQRCVTLDIDNGEAWNNLASVYIRLHKKPEAFRALQQALKFKRESFKIWENYLFVATAVGEWTEAMRAMEQVVELMYPKLKEGEKESCLDLEILKIFVEVATGKYRPEEVSSNTQMEDIEEEAETMDIDLDDYTSAVTTKQPATTPPALLHKPLQTLFANLLSLIGTSAGLYEIVADYYSDIGHLDVALDNLEKSYRVVLNKPSLATEEGVLGELVGVASKLVSAYLEWGPEVLKSESEARFKAKMVVRGVVSKTRDPWEDHELVNGLKEKLGA